MNHTTRTAPWLMLFTRILLHWRPRWLPFMAIIHALMNMSFAFSFLSVAY